MTARPSLISEKARGHRPRLQQSNISSEVYASLEIERTVSGFGGEVPKWNCALKIQVCSSTGRRKQSGDRRRRMIEDVPRIDTKSEALGLVDLNSFFDRHVGRPRTQTFNWVPSKRTAGAGQRSLQHDL